MSGSVVASKVAADMKTGSWIREMFDRGRRLKAEFGEDNVHDFSLGNPNGVPPREFFEALQAVVSERDSAKHRYMPTAGFPETREAVAGYVAGEYGIDVDRDSMIMTVGAAGGMNVALQTICNPGDEIIVLAPYFPVYRTFIEHAGSRMRLVQTDAQFQPDFAAIEEALNGKTRGIIINSPNNPSGAVYSAEICQTLADLLTRHDSEDRPLYLLLDDPYRRLVYQTGKPATPATRYHRTLLISSYSKDLSIAGERCGYIAVPSTVPQRELVIGALTMLNRSLGFVNAPALIQRVVARCATAVCDIDRYRRNRDLLCTVLRDAGYELITPVGGMFAFPRTPIEDDVAFVDLLVEQRVLTVPGRGFGRPGHIRISFAVEPETIERAAAGFRAAIEAVR